MYVLFPTNGQNQSHRNDKIIETSVVVTAQHFHDRTFFSTNPRKIFSRYSGSGSTEKQRFHKRKQNISLPKKSVTYPTKNTEFLEDLPVILLMY